MPLSWKLTLSLLLSINLCLAPTALSKELIAQMTAGASSQAIKPERLYERVWNIVKEDYYDQNYNGQCWDYWKNHYNGKLKTQDDAHKAIETMLSSLGDRYTRFLDKEAFSDERDQIDAHLFGIGVQIGLDKAQHVIVIAPIEDTPASRAGILAGDEIAEINGKNTKGMSVDEAAQNIKGPKDTLVVLTIARGSQKKKMLIMRDEIHINAIQTAKMLDNNVGYVRLTSFISQQANDEMKNALSNLSKAKGIILDLRDNPGGLLSNAIEISNMFIEGKSNIVSTVDRDGYKTQTLSDGNSLYNQQLIILINGGSASASEITSGALKDNARAVLVGQKTFGKGLVQGITRLEDGSGINVTIARYLTPSDTDINKKGISPDVPIELSDDDYKDGKGPWWSDPGGPQIKRSPEDRKDLQLTKAWEIMKDKLNTPYVLGHAPSK